MDKSMVIRIYDYFRTHRMVLWSSLIAVTLLLVSLIVGLSYKEDITDFLPLNEDEKQYMSIYQNVSGANKLIVIFDSPDDADKTCEAIDLFEECLALRDSLGWCSEMFSSVDAEQMTEVRRFVYDNIPYFLTDADYTRMDSLLENTDYVSLRLISDREQLMFPISSMIVEGIANDPLNLYAPVFERMRGAMVEHSFEMYDGRIFTPDMSRALVTINSPFGGSETSSNGQLLSLIDSTISDVRSLCPDVNIHTFGGPAIAVDNATQIKHDSMLAVTLSVVLILAILFYSFRTYRNLLFIALSIGWGWLFALGAMAVFRDQISIIVIGILSIIIGIAVNYPLHLVAHLRHQPNVRAALSDIVKPLLVGNITTVGAFLALVPSQSSALRDLGLFASFLLVGTIIFVLLYLPHCVKSDAKTSEETLIFGRLADIKFEKNRWIVGAIIVLTLVFGWFAPGVQFDTNMSNLNYMSDQHRLDARYFQNLSTDIDSLKSISETFLFSSGKSYDEALENDLDCQVALREAGVQSKYATFIRPKTEQEASLSRWKSFVEKYNSKYKDTVEEYAIKAGFQPSALTRFHAKMDADYEVQSAEYF
ncbi:MAG: MMPL family transporter, partial [Bacteroidaceae bacterium]|nr:MMPL family transporter [Bacteroidaceae bacterium]